MGLFGGSMGVWLVMQARKVATIAAELKAFFLAALEYGAGFLLTIGTDKTLFSPTA
jgi:hypothetical protein